MEAANNAGPIKLKPNKPEVFSGTHNFLIVNTWLYKLDQYFNLVQLANSNVLLSDENRISFATTLFTGTAAIWWYTVLKANNAPQTWEEFTAAIRQEFVPEDHERRARDSLRSCQQTGTVAEYLSRFRNIVLTVPDMSQSEKWDKFVGGLKSKIQFEVRKANCFDFEEATKIAMHVEAAFNGLSLGFASSASASTNAAPEAMDIGNTNARPTVRSRQRLEDTKNNACFTCHKPGCRPWKHRHRNTNSSVDITNAVTALAEAESTNSDSSQN